MLVFWHDCHKLSLVTAPLHGLDRDNWKKKRGGGNSRNHEDNFSTSIPAFTVQAFFRIVLWPHVVTSIYESDLNHYYFQLLWDDKANVSSAWMGEKNYYFFFPRVVHQCLQKKRKERVKYFSDCFSLIYFRLWYTKGMSQCLVSWNYHKKNLSLLSQIMFKLQPDSNEMENHYNKKNGLEVKIWRGKLLKMQSLIMPSLSLHQLIVR